MFFHPLQADATPWVLFRAVARSTDQCYLRARRTSGGPPSLQEFDDRLSWAEKSTPFISFGNWRRALAQRNYLESTGARDIVVIAVWTKGLASVYSAEESHRDEYLVEGRIRADEYRILAVFEGGGPERNVVFECLFIYQASTIIPNGFFPGRRSSNALEDIEDEIYYHSGVRNDMKRDVLVQAITGWHQFFPIIHYELQN
ncbi:hypothetical protein BDV38DRAFT_275130 [Aspergillus pseudotamarii]|uniref:Uncharacterized protein n=1 Tax=Aspergillus pseudotamarii TaxID=132259 RepID=A0A5N6SFG4_ASPPS|nr:uncharacterized protein BDV38DRAFT_275130 [Aspergillus pseudotamarii]KAE8132450.1 hypothetical protein BDV38DRAFT_275130 [Aspergillus pseudotamarii]